MASKAYYSVESNFTFKAYHHAVTYPVVDDWGFADVRILQSREIDDLAKTGLILTDTTSTCTVLLHVHHHSHVQVVNWPNHAHQWELA